MNNRNNHRLIYNQLNADTMEVGDSIILKNRKHANALAYKMKRDGKQVTIEKKTKRWGGTYGFSVLRTK